MSTPETDTMASMRRTHQEWQAHGEKLERERDDAREKLSELIEEEKTLRYGLRTLSKNAAEKRIEISDRLDRALAERDEARSGLQVETWRADAGWQRADQSEAERDEARASLAAAEAWSAVLADIGDDFRAANSELRCAIRNLRNVQGRHHTQLATERLFSLLPENK